MLSLVSNQRTRLLTLYWVLYPRLRSWLYGRTPHAFDFATPIGALQQAGQFGLLG